MTELPLCPIGPILSLIMRNMVFHQALHIARRRSVFVVDGDDDLVFFQKISSQSEGYSNYTPDLFHQGLSLTGMYDLLAND